MCPFSADMNAQTADMTDFTTDVELFDRSFDFDADVIRFYEQRSGLEKLNIQLHRKSQDKKKNNNGYKLIEACKNNNLTILNGRFGQDKNVGKFVFRDISVIDYVLATKYA